MFLHILAHTGGPSLMMRGLILVISYKSLRTNIVLIIRLLQLIIIKLNVFVELSNREVEQILEKVVKTNRKDWALKLNVCTVGLLYNFHTSN